MTKLRPNLPDIYAAGWRVRAGLAVASPMPWPALDDREPDIRFIEAPLDWGLDDAVVDRGVIQFARDGRTLVQFGDVGRFLVTADQVTCDPDVAADAPVMTPVLFGNIMAVLCWRRRQLPLHAAAVAIGGRAVILTGPARVGKSVIAATLLRRGHALLADEVAVLSDATCLPLGGPLQLAEDALAAAGIDPAELPSYATWQPRKFHWRDGPAPEPRPYPLAALFRLRKAAGGAPIAPDRLQGEAAVDAILHQIYWPDMLDLLDSRAWAVVEAQRILAAAPAWQLPVPHDFAHVEAVADAIERLVSDLPE